MRGCGFAYPPIEGTHDREVVDRFLDFLQEAPGASAAAIAACSPARRYRIRFLAWRLMAGLPEVPA